VNYSFKTIPANFPTQNGKESLKKLCRSFMDEIICLAVLNCE